MKKICTLIAGVALVLAGTAHAQVNVSGVK